MEPVASEPVYEANDDEAAAGAQPAASENVVPNLGAVAASVMAPPGGPAAATSTVA